MRHHRPSALALTVLVALTACQDDRTVVAPERTDPGTLAVPEAPRLSPLTGGAEGYPTIGEKHTGFIVGPDGRPFEIVYEIHDGFAVWQGDILIGREGEIAETIDDLDLGRPGPLRGVVIDGDGGSNRWPNGVVPYTIHALNPPDPSTVDQAIDWIHDQTPGVTLVPRGNQADYVTFQNASGCSSSVGRIGGQQFINLNADGDNACSVAGAAHEILHALGMYHEHSRCDRDQFVMIDYTQIIPGRASNFYAAGSNGPTEPCGDDQAVWDLFDYDFGSIMHYSVDAFALSSDPTIIPIVTVPDGVMLGQRDGLSDTDAATIQVLYGSNNAPPVATATVSGDLLEGTSVTFDGSASTDPDDNDEILTYTWILGDGTCPMAPKCAVDSLPHVYVDDGTYGWALLVSDGFDAGTAGGILKIENVAPTVDAGPDVELESGQTLDVSADFSDKGVHDRPWSWTIDWGDGTDDTGSTNNQFLPISASHQVCEVGSQTVAVNVTDKDGGTGSDELTLTVSPIAIGIDIMPGSDSNPINLKKGGNLPVAILGSTELDVASVDPSTLVLGDEVGSDTPAAQKNDGSYQAQMEDVNEDGLTDLVVMFPNRELTINDLTDTTTELVLRGLQADGCSNLRGVDEVSVLGS